MPPETTENPYATPSAESQRVDGKYTFAKNPRFLTQLLVGLLVIFFLKSLFFYLEAYIIRILPQRSFHYPGVKQLNLLIFFTTHILFCMWTYRAAVNSRGFGAQGMRHSPAWAIGWYFIPIMNLYRPYQAMKEIWQVSGNPDDWKAQKGGRLLLAWWTLWLAHNIFILLWSVSQYYTEIFHTFRYSFLKESIDTLLDGGLVATAIAVVLTITRRQQALVAASGE